MEHFDSRLFFTQRLNALSPQFFCQKVCRWPYPPTQGLFFFPGFTDTTFAQMLAPPGFPCFVVFEQYFSPVRISVFPSAAVTLGHRFLG